LASLGPARTLGIGGQKGSLEPHKDADVVIFSDEFKVIKTFVGGRLEYQAP
jgi:N-acetylglucosamine-6-phosphate deacetylase